MRVKKEAKPIEMTCKCGKNYIAYSTKAAMCPDCRKVRKIEYRKKYHEWEKEKRRLKRETKTFKPMRRAAPKKSIKEVIKELNKYNRENNMHLSYGQYVALVDN